MCFINSALRKICHLPFLLFPYPEQEIQVSNVESFFPPPGSSQLRRQERGGIIHFRAFLSSCLSGVVPFLSLARAQGAQANCFPPCSATPGGLHLKPRSSLSSLSQGMSLRSSLPGSRFGGFSKIVHLPHLLARGHRAATPKSTCAPALRSAPAHGIPSALGPPPAPRAAATGAAPGAQVPDP